jgi:hypothetical protein
MTFLVWIKDNLERRSRWESLRKLGSSPLVRTSLVFAAAGYLLIWNAKIQDFLAIKFDTSFSNWRIWMVYYGGIALAVATGLYSWFCPKFIKDYESAFRLAESQSEHFTTMGLGPEYLANLKKLEASCSSAERALFPSNRPQDSPLERRPTNREIFATFMVYEWNLHNIRFPVWRRIILVLYCFGFGLLGLPALVTFVPVTFAGLRLWM